MSALGSLLREPLLHFTLAGGLLFAGHAWLNPVRPEADGPVRIGQGEISWLRQTFSSQWRRYPTDDEMKLLVETLVREQLLAREARSLGLDRDDTIVRRRLAQKLTFLVEETARIADPDDRELRTFQAANAERYRSEPRLSFQQVFFSPKRRPDASADASAALFGIPGAGTPEGDPLPLESAYSRADPAGISSLFGPTFAETIFATQPGVWVGPVKSAYGMHLVLVTGREEGSARAFEEVRQMLLDDWRRQKANEAREAFLDKLREKYGVIVDAAVAAAAAPTAVVAAGL